MNLQRRGNEGLGRLGRGGGDGSGDPRPRRRCLGDAAEFGSLVVRSVNIGHDERRQNQAMKLAYSGCSGEDDVVGVASVDGEGARDLVKTMVGIERSRNTKGGGSG